MNSYEKKNFTLQVGFQLLRHASKHVFHIPSLLSNGLNNKFRTIQSRSTENRNCTKTCNERPTKSASLSNGWTTTRYSDTLQ